MTTVVPTANATTNATLTLRPGVAGGRVNVVRTPGSTVFIGESGLDITGTGIAAGDTLGWFQAGADVATSSPDDTMIISDPANVFVQPGTRTGAWYDLNKNRAIGINVKDPSLSLSVWDVQSNSDVTDKTVINGRLLTFRIDSNLDAVYAQRGVGAPVTVLVMGPDGNVYAALFDDQGNLNSLVNVPVTSSSMLVPGKGTNGCVVDTGNGLYETGEFKVWAECNLNGMKDNYPGPLGETYIGKTVTRPHTITLVREELSIEASTRDTVTRSADFAVTVNGAPNAAYALWVAGSANVNEPPRIKERPAGVIPGDATAGALAFSGTRTVAEDVPATNNTTTNPWYARVVADDNGQRTVGFSTSQNTKDQSYTIRVQTLNTTTTSKYRYGRHYHRQRSRDPQGGRQPVLLPRRGGHALGH